MSERCDENLSKMVTASICHRSSNKGRGRCGGQGGDGVCTKY